MLGIFATLTKLAKARALALLLLSVFVSPAALSAQSYPPGTTDRVPNNDPLQEYPRRLDATKPMKILAESVNALPERMAVSSDGTVHMLWVAISGSHEYLYYGNNKPEMREQDGFSTLTSANLVKDYEKPSWAEFWPEYGPIAVTDDGKIAVAYYTPERDSYYHNGTLQYTGYWWNVVVRQFTPGTGWGSEQVLAQGMDHVTPDVPEGQTCEDRKTYGHVDLAYDRTGHLHAAVYETHKRWVQDSNGNPALQNEDLSIKYSQDIGSLSTIVTGDGPDIEGQDYPWTWPAHVIRTGPDSSGTGVSVQVAWAQHESGQTTRIKHADSAGSWSVANATDASVWSIPAFDMAMSADGVAHLAYVRNTAEGRKLLYRARAAGGSFGSEEETSEEEWSVQPYCKIVTDARCKPVIVASSVNLGTKVDNDVPTPNRWVFQLKLSNSHSSLRDVAISPGNEFVHTLGNSGYYCRTTEQNLGAQDSFTVTSFGPANANVATGNLNFTLPLFSARSGAGFSTSFSLVYNSLDGTRTSIGQGWSTSYDIYLTASPYYTVAGDPIQVHFGDGRVIAYSYDGWHGYYAAPDSAGEYSRVDRDTPAQGQYQLTTKTGIKYIFDSTGRLSLIQDTNSNQMELVYGDNPNAGGTQTLLTAIRDSMYSSRSATTLEYDAYNRLQKVTDPAGKTYTLSYQAMTGTYLGNLEYVQFDGAPTGQTVKWQFAYYTANQYSPSSTPPVEEHKQLLSKIYTPRGRIGDYFYRYGYRLDGRVVSVTMPEELSIVDDDDIDAVPESVAVRREIVYIDPAPHFFQQEAHYDPPNLVVTPPTERKVPAALVKNGRQIPTRIEYEYVRCLANRVEDAQADGPGILRRYFSGYDFNVPYASIAWGRDLIRSVDAQKAVTKYTYYSNTVWYTGIQRILPTSDLKEVFRPQGDKFTDDPTDDTQYINPVTYTYTEPEEGPHRVKSVTDSNGKTTTYSYDAAGKGNLVRIDYPTVTLANNATQEAYEEFPSYDSRGRVQQSKDANGHVTSYYYTDAVTGLVTSVQRPGSGGPETFTYYAMGDVHTHTVPGAGTTTSYYDGLYRLKEVNAPQTQAGSPWTRYEYDEDSNLVKVTDAKTHVSESEYDKLGRLALAENNNQKDTRYYYDRDGQVRKSKDFNTVTGDSSSKTLYDEVGRVKESRGRITNPLVGGPDWSRATSEYYLDGRLKTRTTYGTDVLTTESQYDARGNVTAVIHPQTSIVDAFSYDLNDNQMVAVRRDGSTFQYGTYTDHDERGRVRGTMRLTADPAGGLQGLTTGHVLDPNGNRTLTVDPSGRTTGNVYDDRGRLTEVKDALGVTVQRITYNAADLRTKVEILNPETETLTTHKEFFYNDANQLTSEKDAFGNETTFVYDLNGNMEWKTDPHGVITHWEYDNLDRLQFLTEDYGGLSLTTTYGYDDNGNRTSTVDPRGKTYGFVFDRANRMVKMTYPGGSYETWTYDAHGRMETHRDQAGTVATYGYDLMSRPTSEVYGVPFGITVIMEDYDGFGHPRVIRDGSMRIENDYDALGRQTSSTWKIDGVVFKSVGYTYDDSSNRETMTDPEGVLTSYEYDANNRLERIRRAGTLYTSFAYYPGGQLKDTIFDQAGGAYVRRSYNNRLDLARIETVGTSSAIASYAYEYDAVGRRTKATMEHLSNAMSYGYDNMSRLTSESWSGNDPATSSGFTNAFTDRAGGNESAQSAAVSAPPLALVSIPSYVGVYTYDAAGNRTSKVTSEGARSCAYDDLNRLTEESGGGTLILEPASAGATSTQSGFDVAKAIDGSTADGQSSGVAWRSSEAATTHEFTATFEAVTPVNRIDVFIPSGLGDLGKFKVQWDNGSSYVDLPSVVALGAEPHPTDAGWWRSTARQIAFLCPQIVTNHVKFIQAPGGGPLSTPNVAWLNELRATGGNLAAAIAYTYDDNGNQKTRIDGTTRETFGYDHRNRLVSYVKDDTQTQAVSSHVMYAFSPTGQRYEKHTLARSGTATDEKELFMYDGEDVATDYTQAGSGPIDLAVSYVQGLSIDSKIARIAAGTSAVHYYVPDALGSVTKIIDASQATVNSYYTTAWGEPLPGAPSGGPLADRYGFAQRENDAESGLYYNRARTLDTRIGRFGQAEPIVEDRLREHFIYVGNDPANRTDPSGLGWLWTTPNPFRLIKITVNYSGGPPQCNAAVALCVERIVSRAITADSRNMAVRWDFKAGTAPVGGVGHVGYRQHAVHVKVDPGWYTLVKSAVARHSGCYETTVYNGGFSDSMRVAGTYGHPVNADVFLANVLVHEIVFHSFLGYADYPLTSYTGLDMDLTRRAPYHLWTVNEGFLPTRFLGEFLDMIDE